MLILAPIFDSRFLPTTIAPDTRACLRGYAPPTPTRTRAPAHEHPAPHALASSQPGRGQSHHVTRSHAHTMHRPRAPDTCNTLAHTRNTDTLDGTRTGSASNRPRTLRTRAPARRARAREGWHVASAPVSNPRDARGCPRTGAEDRRQGKPQGEVRRRRLSECYPHPNPPATRTRLPAPEHRARG